MTNKVRGDSELLAGGKSLAMRLTLGALAEIEDGLGNGGGLSGIAGSLKSLGSKDIALVASALLRGGGTNVTPAEVMNLETDVGTLVGAITGAFKAAGGTKSETTPAASPLVEAPPNTQGGNPSSSSASA